jgi:hypothetical protein
MYPAEVLIPLIITPVPPIVIPPQTVAPLTNLLPIAARLFIYRVTKAMATCGITNAPPIESIPIHIVEVIPMVTITSIITIITTMGLT